MTDNSLSGYYASMGIIEGKIAEQEVLIRTARANLDGETMLLQGYLKDRRELHRLIAALKKRPAKVAAGDPAMPAALRRAGT